MLTVINYHYIRPNFEAKYPSVFGVTLEQFEGQLIELFKIGNFVSIKDLVENTHKIVDSEEMHILITFDDGLKEQYNFAIPILDKLNLPAVFFINSINHIEKKVSLVHQIHLVRSVISSEDLYQKLIDFSQRTLTREEKEKAIQFYRFDDRSSAELKYFLNVILDLFTQEIFVNSLFLKYFNEQEVIESLYMSEKEIKNLAHRGYLGSHTHTHLPLGIYDEKIIQFELETTKNYLENLTGQTINLVAYPYGTKEAATQTVGKIAKKVGYKLGFTTNPDTNKANQNILLLNRFDTNDVLGGNNYKK
jgi:peptidoglycan/xylan/chitin deacetylase (PgdA/CDA1 family)